jgi:hypothetical protein
VDQLGKKQAEQTCCDKKNTGAILEALNRHDSARLLHVSANYIPILLRADCLHQSARSEFGPRIWISMDELLRVVRDRDWRGKANGAVRAH